MRRQEDCGPVQLEKLGKGLLISNEFNDFNFPPKENFPQKEDQSHCSTPHVRPLVFQVMGSQLAAELPEQKGATKPGPTPGEGTAWGSPAGIAVRALGIHHTTQSQAGRIRRMLRQVLPLRLPHFGLLGEGPGQFKQLPPGGWGRETCELFILLTARAPYGLPPGLGEARAAPGPPGVGAGEREVTGIPDMNATSGARLPSQVCLQGQQRPPRGRPRPASSPRSGYSFPGFDRQPCISAFFPARGPCLPTLP